MKRVQDLSIKYFYMQRSNTAISKGLMAMLLTVFSGIAHAQSFKDWLRDTATSYTIRKYGGAIKLPDGRTLYRVVLSPPPRCFHCPTGILYYDSACVNAAAFTYNGRIGTAHITPAYSGVHFIESTNPIYKAPRGVYGNDANKYVDPFAKPISYKVKAMHSSAVDFMRVNDNLIISAAAGMQHFRNGKLINSYKIIPQRITETYIDPKDNTAKEDFLMVYYIEPLKKYIKPGDHGLFFTAADHAANELKIIDAADWVKVLETE